LCRPCAPGTAWKDWSARRRGGLLAGVVAGGILLTGLLLLPVLPGTAQHAAEGMAARAYGWMRSTLHSRRFWQRDGPPRAAAGRRHRAGGEADDPTVRPDAEGATLGRYAEREHAVAVGSANSRRYSAMEDSLACQGIARTPASGPHYHIGGSLSPDDAFLEPSGPEEVAEDAAPEPEEETEEEQKAALAALLQEARPPPPFALYAKRPSASPVRRAPRAPPRPPPMRQQRGRVAAPSLPAQGAHAQ